LPPIKPHSCMALHLLSVLDLPFIFWLIIGLKYTLK
jgi:hypothetical protein